MESSTFSVSMCDVSSSVEKIIKSDSFFFRAKDAQGSFTEEIRVTGVNLTYK